MSGPDTVNAAFFRSGSHQPLARQSMHHIAALQASLGSDERLQPLLELRVDILLAYMGSLLEQRPLLGP